VKEIFADEEYKDRDQYFKDHMKRFQNIFGFTVPKDITIYLAGGGLSLDVIVLDELLHPPDGTSTHDYIKQTYGDEASEMVEKMI